MHLFEWVRYMQLAAMWLYDLLPNKYLWWCKLAAVKVFVHRNQWGITDKYLTLFMIINILSYLELTFGLLAKNLICDNNKYIYSMFSVIFLRYIFVCVFHWIGVFMVPWLSKVRMSPQIYRQVFGIVRSRSNNLNLINVKKTIISNWFFVFMGGYLWSIYWK
jgi:hypothetical protein